MSSVSHQLKTPLNGSITMLEIANNENSIPLKIKETILRPALYCNKLLMYIVNDIIDYSKLN